MKQNQRLILGIIFLSIFSCKSVERTSLTVSIDRTIRNGRTVLQRMGWRD